MQTSSPILYPLYSAAEVLFVEKSLAEFRAKAADGSAVQNDSASPSRSWEQMTQAEKFTTMERDWTLEALRDIKPWVLENETVLAAIDLSAKTPGKWVTFKEACSHARMIPSQGRGQMQALTKKRNQMKKTTWPMLANATPPGVRSLAYLMSDTLAQRWNTVRSEP